MRLPHIIVTPRELPITCSLLGCLIVNDKLRDNIVETIGVIRIERKKNIEFFRYLYRTVNTWEESRLEWRSFSIILF